jgi:hypothetical protein
MKIICGNREEWVEVIALLVTRGIQFKAYDHTASINPNYVIEITGF